jgi:hypothetical protein
MARTGLVWCPPVILSLHITQPAFSATQRAEQKQNISNSPITLLRRIHNALIYNFAAGHAMTVGLEARVRSQASACGICGRQSGRGTGFSPGILVFPGQYHSTCSPCSLITDDMYKLNNGECH